MKRTAPYWETPLDLFKLLMTALAAALLLGMLRGCIPGGAAVDTPDAEMPDAALPGADLGITAPAFNLPSIPEADLPSLADGGYEFGGVALPGSEVEIFDGDLSLGKVLAGPDGKWVFALPALAAGAHALRAVAPDLDGNPFEMSLPAFDLPEMEMPELEMSLPAFDLPEIGDIFVAADLPSLSGTAPAGSMVQLFDGDELLGEVEADADGRWSFALPELLGLGAHEMRAVVLGEDGEELSSEAWSFIIDAPEAEEVMEEESMEEVVVEDEAPVDEGSAEDDSDLPAALPKTGRASITP